MDFLNDEEEERRFTTAKIIKILVVMLIIAAVLSVVYLVLEKRSKERVTENAEAMLEEERDLELTEKPFILDDGDDKIVPSKKEVVSSFPNRESIEKELILEKGDRICEYKEIDLPEIIEAGSLIDVRISLADGRDYTVLSKKKVGDFFRKDEKEIIWLSLSDLEIIFMESALSDLSLFRKARLYTVIHNSEEANSIEVNYPVNYKSEKLIKKSYKEDIKNQKLKLIKNEELNEDRRRLIEIGAENISKWREAATYWNNE